MQLLKQALFYSLLSLPILLPISANGEIHRSLEILNDDAPSLRKNFYIQLSEKMINSGDRHIVALSDVNGNVLHHRFLQPRDARILGPFKNIPDKSFVTVASESDDVYSTNKQPLNIRTFQVSSDTLYVKVNERKTTNSTYKDVRLQIKGVTSFNEQVNFAEGYASKLKIYANRNSHILQRSVSKKGLKLHFSCSMEQDLYILLRCNKEKQYRYIFFDKNEIPDNTIIEWDDLGVDLEHATIDLPETGKWNTTILGKKSGMSSFAYLYREMLDHELGKIPVFNPQGGLFDEYHIFAAQATPYENTYFRYSETSDDLPFVEAMDIDMFNVELERISPQLISISRLNNNLKGELTLLLSNSDMESIHPYFTELISSSYSLEGTKIFNSTNRHLLDIPTWTIYFEPIDSKFAFKTPKIDSILKKYLNSNILWGLNEYGVFTLSYSTNPDNQYSGIIGLMDLQ